MFQAVILTAVVLAQVAGPMPVIREGPMIPAPAGASDGITVSGAGYASTRATDARVTLHVSARNNALTLNAQTLQPIVDALVRAGADHSSVALPPYLVGQAHTNSAAVTADVHHPTPAMLQQGMLTLADAFAAMPDVLLNSAQVRLSANDCAALQRTAESKAIANARSNAAFLAKQIGARAGDVLAIQVSGMPAGAQGACTFMYSMGPFGSPFSQPSPDGMLTVKVYSSVTMRFAIRHG